MRTRLLLSIAVVGAVVLGGCAKDEPPLGPDGGSSSSEVGTDLQAAPGIVADAPARSQFSDGVSERQDVITGYLALTADDPQRTADRAEDLVTERDGRVDSRTDSPAVDEQIASSSLTIRVPASDLDPVLDELKDLGRVTSSSLDRSDVTMQSQDLSARIAALQATVDRFRQLLTTAADTADLIAIETALSDRQGELDSLRSQQTSLDDRIDLATITLQITATDPEDASSGGVGGAVVDGWNALIGALGATVLFVAAAVPWIGFVLVIALLVLVVVRLRRRRRQTPPANPS